MHHAPSYAPRLPLDIGGSEFIHHKVETYHWMLEERPVCPITFSMLRGHFVCRYEDCELVLRGARFRRQRPDVFVERFPTIELASPSSKLTFVPTASLNAYAALPMHLM